MDPKLKSNLQETDMQCEANKFFCFIFSLTTIFLFLILSCKEACTATNRFFQKKSLRRHKIPTHKTTATANTTTTTTKLQCWKGPDRLHDFSIFTFILYFLNPQFSSFLPFHENGPTPIEGPATISASSFVWKKRAHSLPRPQVQNRFPRLTAGVSFAESTRLKSHFNTKLKMGSYPKSNPTQYR